MLLASGLSTTTLCCSASHLQALQVSFRSLSGKKLSSPDFCGLQVAETAVQFFIAGDRPNVAGLVLAGSAEFKTELSDSDMFDQRLKAAVLAVVDVSYGMWISPVHHLEASPLSIDRPSMHLWVCCKGL